MNSIVLWFFGGVLFSFGAIAMGVIGLQIFGGRALKNTANSLEYEAQSPASATIKRAA